MITICNHSELYVTITLIRKENIKMDNKQTTNKYKTITSQNVKLERENVKDRNISFNTNIF